MNVLSSEHCSRRAGNEPGCSRGNSSCPGDLHRFRPVSPDRASPAWQPRLPFLRCDGAPCQRFLGAKPALVERVSGDRRARGVPLARWTARLRASFSADCSLTASDQQVVSRAATHIHWRNTMRITIATVLAICGHGLLHCRRRSRARRQQSPRQAQPPAAGSESRDQSQRRHGRSTRDAAGHRPQDRGTDHRVPHQERRLQAHRRSDERERHRREELPQAQAAGRRAAKTGEGAAVTDESRRRLDRHHRRRRRSVVLMAAIAVPVVGGTLERERTIIGAQYLAGQLQRARLDSLKRARSVAVRSRSIGDRTQLQLFADGNGNGVLQRDIDRGIDPAADASRLARRSGARRLAAHQPGRSRTSPDRRRSSPATIRCASATRRSCRSARWAAPPAARSTSRRIGVHKWRFGSSEPPAVSAC